MNLLPCPFCGSPATLTLIEAHAHVIAPLPPSPDTWVLECDGCDAGFCGGDAESVTQAWNRRASTDTEVRT